MLNKAQKQFLKGEANTLRPTVMIGKNGLTDSIITSVEEGLTAHELIKISVLSNCDEPASELAIEIASETKSEIVCQLGKKIVLYRRNPDNICYILPR